MSSQLPPHVVEDCHGILKLYSDGTIFRSKDLNLNFPVHDDGSVLWKDCQFHQSHHLHLRLYKPLSAITSSSASLKLPVVYFFHGGGFCVGSRTWPNFHNCCIRLCSGLQALVVAPDYRLAPEHRLPAALEDAFSALKWLQFQAINTDDAWLGDGVLVDFDHVYVMGDSCGGNLAHHLAVQLGPGSPELSPVRLRGYVLMAPFFGGTVRTKSEMEGSEPIATLELLDCFWRLSLPIGETADHPLANPFGPLSPSLESVMLDPLLVMVGGDELLRDRAEYYASRLKKKLGKAVQYVEYQGKTHAFFTNEPYSQVSNEVLQEIKNFMAQNS